MYWDKEDKKYIEKIKIRVLSRKTIFFHRNLSINYELTNIKIIKFSDVKKWSNFINGYKELPDEITYCLVRSLSKTIGPFLNSCEFVITNNKNMVINILTSCIEIKKIYTGKPINIWCFREGTVNYFNIKLNDIISTKN